MSTVGRPLTSSRSSGEGTERAVLQMRAIALLSAAINDAPTTDAVLDVVVRGVRDAVRTDYAALLLLDDDGDVLRIAASAGLPQELAARARVPVGTGVAGRVVASRQSTIIDDVTAVDDVQPYLRDVARSIVCVPLVGEGRVLGVLHTGSRHRRTFTPEDVTLLELVSARAASAFLRSQVLDHERAARARAERLQALSADLTRVRTQAEAIDVVMHHVVAGLDAYASGVVELSEDGTEFLMLGSKGYSEETRARYARHAMDARIPVCDALRDNVPVFLGNRAAWLALYERAPVLPADLEDGAWVVLPLAVENRLLGALTISLRSSRPFVESERRFLQAFADLCAQALERARLSDAERASQRRADEARVRAEQLQALTAALARTLTAQEVAEAAVREAGHAVGAISGTITLLEEDGTHFTLLPGPGMPPDVSEAWKRFPNNGISPAATAVRTLEPCYSPTRADFLLRNPKGAALVDRVGLEANVALPLVVDAGSPNQRVFGALTFAFGEPRTFGFDDDAFLRAAADQCAQALDRARLFEAERRARAEADVARERADRLRVVTAALGAARTPEEVATTIVREGMRLLGAQGAGVGVLEADDTRFRFDQLRGSAPETAAAWNTFPNDRSIPYGEAVATRRVLCLPSNAAVAARFPRVAPDLERRGLQSLVVFPLIGSDDTVFGAAHLAFPDAHDFGPSETREFEDLAQACGQALERALLYEAERAARAEAESARAAAEAANRAKMDFLTTMSHELRTPLNAIGGYAELIALGVRGTVTAQQQEDLNRIQKNQQHLLGLINEVLNFARLESGAVRYELTELRVAPFLTGMEALVLPQVRAKGLTLSFDVNDTALVALADAEKLRQVLLNLLSNALKFTPAGGAITVSAARAAGEAGARATVRISVHDTGVGIPPEQHDAVFEPFVQVGRSFSSPGEGTGLGLAISRDLARGMGGNLTVESAPGTGSTFTVTLPLVE